MNLPTIASLKQIGFSCATFEQSVTISDGDLLTLKADGLTRIRLINALNDATATIVGSVLTANFLSSTFLNDRLAQCSRLGLALALSVGKPPLALCQQKERLCVTISTNSNATTYSLTVAGSSVSVTGQATAQLTAVALCNAASGAAGVFLNYDWVSNGDYNYFMGTAKLAATVNTLSSGVSGGSGTISSSKNAEIFGLGAGQPWSYSPCRGSTQDATDYELMTQYVEQIINYVKSYGIGELYLDIGNEMDISSTNWTLSVYSHAIDAAKYVNVARCFVDAKARTNGINVVIAGSMPLLFHYPSHISSSLN